ncbi:MAG: sulfite exporter TauE/SafE family protein [Candidatus Parcubacteria bacterium]|nr:sulfite exporter TauE/SafE family protein [Candidatus Parcubacteria bacterium]
MIQKINLNISSPISIENKAKLETEIEIMDGINSIKIDEQTGGGQIDYNADKISSEKIMGLIQDLGYAGAKLEIDDKPVIKDHTYYVKGMHCASCEILIEKKLLKIENVKSVEASTSKGQILIEYVNKRPGIEHLNKIFKDSGYTFSEQAIKEPENSSNNIYKTIVIAGLVIAAFILLNKLGIASWVNVSSQSSLPAFFLLGIFAGLSSCAALVGGIILSMSKQWLELYNNADSTWQKMQPHLLFNFGRLASYGILGAVLGSIGSKLQISFAFTSFLVIIISILMFLLALQMLGVKSLQKFQLTMPKFITKSIADETKFSGRYMPALMGAGTFFLPCGFTITAQGLALLSGSALQGGLIMFLFALGTVPMLLAIGLSSIKFSAKPSRSATFLKVAGVIVLFFAIFNVNSQLNVLGLPSFNDVFAKTSQLSSNNSNVVQDNSDLPPIVDGKQILKMDASSYGYTPNNLKVRVGVPVKWEVTDKGTSGCTNAIISQGLFSDQISLTPGQTSIKEFTPDKVGKFKFSCWMGMISGIIEVVSADSVSNPTALNSSSDPAAAPVPSGARGCGCGGGGGNSCGAARN